MNNIKPILTDAEIAAASERSMGLWYLRKVEASGGMVHRANSMSWGVAPGGLSLAGAERIIAVPECDASDADALIQEALQFFHKHKTNPWVTHGGRLTSDEVRQRFKAWGFSFIFAGITMACDLYALHDDFPMPPGLEIKSLDDLMVFEQHEHPYIGKVEKRHQWNDIRATLEMTKQGDAWAWLAWLNGEPVGCITLLVGEGVAGIYDVGVKESARHKKIASILTAHACRFARETQGCEVAVLQTRKALTLLYGGVGFQQVSTIDHWEYPTALMQAPLPAHVPVEDVSLVNEHFLMAMADERIDDAISLLKQHPSIALEKTLPSWGASALHVASWHGYSEIVRLLIEQGADIEAYEDGFGCTPLFWAAHGYGPYGSEIQRDQLGAAALLLKAGAKTELQNKWGDSIIEVVKRPQDEPMRRLLLGNKG